VPSTRLIGPKAEPGQRGQLVETGHRKISRGAQVAWQSNSVATASFEHQHQAMDPPLAQGISPAARIDAGRPTLKPHGHFDVTLVNELFSSL
jgi:hypothetical protein